MMDWMLMEMWIWRCKREESVTILVLWILGAWRLTVSKVYEGMELEGKKHTLA